MAKLEFKSEIHLGSETIQVGSAIESLKTYSSEKIVRFFESLGLVAPRNIRMSALRDTLATSITNESLVLNKLSDEMQYRIAWYNNFSETQLLNLLPQFDEPLLEPSFKKNLWLNLIQFMIEKQIPEKELLSLIHLSQNTQGEAESYAVYNETLNTIFKDEPNQLDGLTPETFRPVLFKSSTLVELREIGKKYGVDVPRRLKKNELVDIIVKELKNQNIYTVELEAKVNKLAVIQLQRFAIEHNVKASIELKKEEIIEYILSNASQTKNQYFVPTDSSVYEALKPSPIQFVEPVIATEPVMEETPKVVVADDFIESEPLDEETEALQADHTEDAPKVNPVIERIEQVAKPEPMKQTAFVEPVSNASLEAIVQELKALRAEVNTYHQMMLDKAYEKAQRPILKPTFVVAYDTNVEKKVVEKDTLPVAKLDEVTEPIINDQEVVIETPVKLEQEEEIVHKRKPRRLIFRILWILVILAFIYATIGILRAFNVYDFGATYGNTDIYNLILNPGYEFGSLVKIWWDANSSYLFSWDSFMNWFNNLF